MGAPSQIIELVNRFREQQDSYRLPSYNETQLRRELVDPFFKALGWDVDNRQGYAEAYKEVIHEDSIKIGGATKVPDYSFRIGGVRKFFVETKKPAVNLRDDPSPAYQLRRYAWSAKLPLSILTDFEELAVYDCRVRPHKDDKPSTARTIYLKYSQYDERWDEIASIFSREAILKGSFDRYAQSTKKKRGTAEVDAAFLGEIEKWRDALARNIALRNPQLTQRQLNTAVQKTIDRIIFLRICEDRGIEPYGRLQSLLNGPRVYARLCELFQQADTKYNSGLFHFHAESGRKEPPDEWTLRLTTDDRVLKDIIRHLYYPESPYEFSVLGADILGRVYEQFLGKVIRLTPSHRAVVEEKPEVRKAGGVYYTPTYIVDYIVQNTVGKLVEGKAAYQVAGRTEKWNRSKQLRPLAVLDPACGSGSFLIGAYQYLLDWYERWYSQNDPDRWCRSRSPTIYEAARPQAGGTGRSFRLTTDERKRILLDHIYGVDIDPQAVEVTKLSLLLKVLEGETRETLQRHLFAKQRALPDLADNIKCGNSLIGPDFYRGKQLDLFDEEERLRINAFDWEAEFPNIFPCPRGRRQSEASGFDAVIGNPPYGASASDHEIEYYRSVFECASHTIDSFALFIENCLHQLRAGGRLGMIVQSAWVSSPTTVKLREVFISGFRPVAFASMPYDVFGAYIDTIIVVAERLRSGTSLLDSTTAPVDLIVFAPRFKLATVGDFYRHVKRADARKWFRAERNEFLVTLSDAQRRVVRKMESIGGIFADICDIQRGVTPFRVTETPPAKNAAPAFTGTVRRYRLFGKKGGFIPYDESLAEYKPPRYFEGTRLLLRELISRQFQLQAVITSNHFVTNKSMQTLLVTDERYAPEYVLAILNSRLLSWYFLSTQSVGRRDDFPKIVLKQTRELPLRLIDGRDKHEVAIHKRVSCLACDMVVLNEKLGSAKTEHERTAQQRQIEATDREIDQLVYELYGLTDEEIRIVEEATAR